MHDHVRSVLAEQNVIMLPSLKGHTLRETATIKGVTEYIVCVDMDFTFIDGDSGESLTISMSGEGQDLGDKAIYKAISGAQKYALMKVFMIPTGDDPEGDSSVVDERNAGHEPTSGNVTPIKQTNKATPTQIQHLATACKKAGMNQELSHKFMDATVGHHQHDRFSVEEVTKLMQSLPAYQEAMGQ